MSGCSRRIFQAFAHKEPDRTPLFEIFQPYQPIHWRVCGRTVATDQAMCWDAMAEGISCEELVEEEIKAHFAMGKYFGLDMIRPNSPSVVGNFERPVKTGSNTWIRNGIEYHLNEKTKLVEYLNPTEALSHSHRLTEERVVKSIESWDGTAPEISDDEFIIYYRIRQLAEAEGLDWVYMGEVGAGTAAAQYPPFLLMWMLIEPDLFKRWLTMCKTQALKKTEAMLKRGYKVIALGGDVSTDKGPIISPELYRTLILPVVREQVDLVHKYGALAVYTSDGNHWAIKDDFFFNSGVDGYKEVDKAAGMTMERLIEEGIDKKICIIGNIDARHTLCLGSAEDVRKEVIHCLEMGRKTPGGHILHASHSVHEDVIPENYFTVVNTYREYFGMERLPC